jgi:probable addiction module antidote protein
MAYDLHRKTTLREAPAKVKTGSESINEVLAMNDRKALLTALRDVVDARGGVGELAGKVPLQRQSLYKVLSAKGNPTLETLGDILQHLGLRLSVAPA